MTRPSQFAWFLLLALMQILAPWVHAHMGRETGGFLHLPGLEFLSGNDAGYAHSDAGPAGTDLIVGVQAGKWDPDELTPSSGPEPEFSALLPVLIALISAPFLVNPVRIAAVLPPPSTHLLRYGAPRAPPAVTALH